MGEIKVSETGWKVVVRSNDHPPPHVHVFKSGRTCRVTIGRPGVQPPAPYPWASPRKTTMNAREVVEAVRLVARHQRAALEKWEAIHGEVE